MLANLHPEGRYTIARKASLIGRLPEAFLSSKNWRGPSPAELAQNCGSIPAAKFLSHAQGRLWKSTLNVSLDEEIVVVESRKPFRTVKEAEACCWLHILKRAEEIHQVFARVNGQFWHMVWEGGGEAQEGSLLEFEVVNGAPGQKPPPGSLVDMAYKVWWSGNGIKQSILVESNEKFEFELGSTAVLPFIEEIVSGMSKGQTIQCQAALCHSWKFDVASPECIELPAGLLSVHL